MDLCRISASLAVQVVSVMLVHLVQIVIPVILAAVDAREEDLQAQHARLSLRMQQVGADTCAPESRCLVSMRHGVASCQLERITSWIATVVFG